MKIRGSNLALLAICGIAIALSILYGKYVMSTVWGESSPEETLVAGDGSIKITLTEGNASAFYDNAVTNLSDLEAVSELILEVEITDRRSMSLQSTETAAEVKAIYKDNTGTLEVGQSIYLIEPFSIVRNEVYMSPGYQTVWSGERYLLFLNPPSAVEGYEFDEKEKISFMPSTALFSRYCISKEETVDVVEETEQQLLYEDYKEYALLTYSRTDADIYNEIFSEIAKEYQ